MVLGYLNVVLFISLVNLLKCFVAYSLFHIAVLAIILVGLLYGFFIAIICGQRINERHYHVLAKQELTKVVTNLLKHVLMITNFLGIHEHCRCVFWFKLS